MFYKGDAVVFTSEERHLENPAAYPPAGTVGILIREDSDGTSLVQWPTGATHGDGRWWTYTALLELYDEGPLGIDEAELTDLII